MKNLKIKRLFDVFPLFSGERTNQSLLIGAPGDVDTLSEVLLALCDHNELSTSADPSACVMYQWVGYNTRSCGYVQLTLLRYKRISTDNQLQSLFHITSNNKFKEFVNLCFLLCSFEPFNN